MRLLDTSTIRLHEFFGSEIPKYAILSHTWEAGEISFKDITKSRNLDAPGWTKVREACKVAKTRGRAWIWIDTCCIDKRSSAELSEAINSMFSWYLKSEECYALLKGFICHEYEEGFGPSFRHAKWFKRGWTLQELLAPAFVVFFDRDWTVVGTRGSLNREISDITGISESMLGYDETLDHQLVKWNARAGASIATRMSWASHRVCTREEDMAYCLLGIFGINMLCSMEKEVKMPFNDFKSKS